MIRILFTLLFITSLVAEEKISSHSIQLGVETLEYTVTVDTGPISYIAYTKDGEADENRPITFAFNGGPGSSSVWLHLGTFGPRRVLSHEEGQSLTAPYHMVDNPETILDLTDIVFIDPMGTGMSQAETPEKEHYSVRKDIEAVGKFIRDYLTKNLRWNNPKYIAGESYGGVRAAGLAEHLCEYGVYLNGLIFISPAIDYQTFVSELDNPTPYFLNFPSYVTTAWYHKKYRPEATLQEVAEEARQFAYQTYAPSLLCRKCFDQEPLNQKISQMSGIPLDLVQRSHGRLEEVTFLLELFGPEEKQVSIYDGRITGHRGYDPFSAAIEGIFSGAIHHYLQKDLGVPNSYTLLSYSVNSKWNYRDYNQWGYPNLMNGLRKALIINPQTKIFVGCGYYDLATPFASAEYCFDHLEVPNISVQMEMYEGGHMYYLNPSARVKFKNDLARFYKGTP